MTVNRAVPAGPVVSRRRVVGTGAALAGGTALQVAVGGRELLDAVLAAGTAAATTTVVERVRRQRDLLVGNIVLRDLAVVSNGGTTFLTPRSGVTSGYLALVLPGQALGEKVYDVSEPLPAGAGGTVSAPQARLAPPAVLAFQVPANTRLDYSVPGLLGWDGLTRLLSSSVAERRPTVLEAPFRLQVRPEDGRHSWVGVGDPVQLVVNGTLSTELWHVRSRGTDAVGHRDDRIPAIARYFNAGQTPDTVGLGALSDAQRSTIQTQTAATQVVDDEAVRQPATLNHLSLTSLGSTLDVNGRWARAQQLISWDHRATIGRDQYVKTVERGWLAPWGHDCALISETWRRMRQVGSNPPEAVLVKVRTLMITPDVDTSVDFARSGTIYPGLRLPFTTVRCTVLRTGPISSDAAAFETQGGRVLSNGAPLVLTFVGTDSTGRQTPFTSRVWYVPGGASVGTAITDYNNQGIDALAADLGGRPVAVAEPVPENPSGTTLPVDSLRVQITSITAYLGGRRRAPFRPEAIRVFTEVPQVTALSGPGTVEHAYHVSFRKKPDNPGGIVLGRYAGTPPAVGGERTGGFVQVPTYQGLSRINGAVLASSPDALSSLASGGSAAKGGALAPTPANIFTGITLLGGIQLTDIVAIDHATVGIPDGVPTSRSESVDGRQTVTMTITPTLHDSTAGPIKFLAGYGGSEGALTIVAQAAAGGSAPAETSVEARLEHVALQLGGLVVLPIEEFRVCVRTGAPLDVDFRAGDVSFLGPLAFLQTLCDILSVLSGPTTLAPATEAAELAGPTVRGSAAGLAPPSVDVDEDGLSLFHGIALPDLPLGAFTLSGLAFGFGLRLPFSGSLVVDLEFASKQSPFQATYLCFGGGGYAAVQLTGGNVSLVEVGVHVAGELGLNLGVASGSVSVQVGLCMALPGAGGVELTVYFRACGRLSVLELITVSTTFELSLTFVEPASGPTMLSGKASLEFKVELLFISKTVSASVTRTLAGGEKGTPIGGAPSARPLGRGKRSTNGDAVNPDASSFRTAYPDEAAWADYCDSYAPLVLT